MPMVASRGAFGPLALLLALSFMSAAVVAQTRDVAGAKDFPGVGRFAGSVITGYQVKDFDAARMQAAPFKDDTTDARRLEGRLRGARRLRHRRLRRHSLFGRNRRAAGTADVGRRLQLSLLRGPQTRCR